MRAIIRLDDQNHETREKSIKLVTIFGNVYAPKSVIKVTGDIITVPMWVFDKKELNPCQMVTGFIGMEEA